MELILSIFYPLIISSATFFAEESFLNDATCLKMPRANT